jgi:hypothetical protein
LSGTAGRALYNVQIDFRLKVARQQSRSDGGEKDFTGCGQIAKGGSEESAMLKMLAGTGSIDSTRINTGCSVSDSRWFMVLECLNR